MTVSASEYAAMASGAYAPQKGKDPLAQLLLFSGGTIKDGEFTVLESTVNYTVFQKEASREIVLSIRGTARAADWASNFLIGIGALTSDPRTRELFTVVRKYKKLRRDVSVTGHSLGGALAAMLSKSENVAGVTFNMGAGLAERISSGKLADKRGENSSSLIHFNTGRDPLSIAGAMVNPLKQAKVFYVRGGEKNPHSMSNFTGLDDNLFQGPLDRSAAAARARRLSDTKISSDSDDEYRKRVVDDAREIMTKMKEIKSFLDAGRLLYNNRASIPANIARRFNELKQLANSVYRNLQSFRVAVQSGNGEGVSTAVRALGRDVLEIRDAGNLDRFISDIGADGNVEFEREVSNSIEEGVDEFDGFEEMEVYDESLDIGIDEEMLEEAGDGINEIGVTEIEEGIGEGVGEGVGEFVGESVGEGAGEIIGESLVDGIAEVVVDSVVSELVGMAVSATAFGIVGAVFDVGLAVYAVVKFVIGARERHTAVLAFASQIERNNSSYDHKFLRAVSDSHIPFPNQHPFTTNAEFKWRNRDTYGNLTLLYLQWRVKNPDRFHPTGGEIARLGHMYRKHFSPGVPLVVPMGRRPKRCWDKENRKGPEEYEWWESLRRTNTYSAKKMLMTVSTGLGWDSYTHSEVYHECLLYYVRRNSDAFKAEFTAFMKEHTSHNLSNLTGTDLSTEVARLMTGVSSASRAYVQEFISLEQFVRRTYSTKKVVSMVAAAMVDGRTHLFSVLVGSKKNMQSSVDGFSQKRGLPVVYRGIENAFSDDGGLLERWNSLGEDPLKFGTYMRLGIMRLLSDPPRSILEQYWEQKIIDNHILIPSHVFWGPSPPSSAYEINGAYTLDRFTQEGGKGKGDNETTDEFVARFKRWQEKSASAGAMVAHSPDPYLPIPPFLGGADPTESTGSTESTCDLRSRKRKNIGGGSLS
jgi:hypothetical protein